MVTKNNSSIEFYIDENDAPKIMVTKNNSSSSKDLYDFVNSITIQTDQSEQS
jgi:hypothetical protein